MNRKKHFTEEQIEKFRNDPNVRDVNENALRFTFEFRTKLYEGWKKENCQGIKRVLTENGYDLKELGIKLIGNLCTNFRMYGCPSNAKHNRPVGSHNLYHTNPKDNKYLLETGRFVKSGKGISFSEAFKNELFSAYPEQSVEEGIRKAGIDPQKVGYQRIYTLQCLFEGGRISEKRTEYSEEVIARYHNHPYIDYISQKQLRFSKAFYNETSFLIEIMKVDEILKMYEIDPEDLTVSVKENLQYKIRHWKRTDDRCEVVSEQQLRIQHRRWKKLTELVEERFRRIREEELPAMNHTAKKKLCYWIQGYPIDPMKIVNTSVLLKRIGISRSSYYSILRNDHYGVKEQLKEKQDEEDAEVIRQVMEYRGYRKGSRQIYMMMSDVTARQFSLKKIRRLMKKYGMISGIREKKQSRIEARKNLEEHKKPNLLKRQFRIAPPNTNILTDVTYIPYGDNKLAYGSACIDAVTGRLYDFTISDHNDMELVSSTVKKLNNIVFQENAVFHSDQGSLYLTDTYQKMIDDLGLRESMAKRGNCWDNAPQESFFGHFKDECDYRDCSCLIELQVRCADYMEYYNTERRQWDRNRMTPIEYEEYLEGLREEEFQQYLEKEQKKYEQMKKRAAELAIERASTLGV